MQNISELYPSLGFNWWTAEKTRPFLIKGGLMEKKTYLIIVTDLKNVWYELPQTAELKFRHGIYNKAIEVQSEGDIIGLLQDYLEGKAEKFVQKFEQVNRKLNSLVKDAFITQYDFFNKKDGNLVINLKLELRIGLPFLWTFKLTPLNEERSLEFLKNNMICPLIETVKTMEKRVDYLNSKYNELERLYHSKVGSIQKNSLSNQNDDDQMLWQDLLTKQKDTESFPTFPESPASHFFMNSYAFIKKPEEKEKKQFSSKVHIEREKSRKSLSQDRSEESKKRKRASKGGGSKRKADMPIEEKMKKDKKKKLDFL